MKSTIVNLGNLARGVGGLMPGDHSRLQLAIPVYQRRYSWGAEEVSQLVEDLTELQSNTRKFMGQIILQQQGEDLFAVVDGQQRLITLLLLLLVIYENAGNRSEFKSRMDLITLHPADHYELQKLMQGNLLNGHLADNYTLLKRLYKEDSQLLSKFSLLDANALILDANDDAQGVFDATNNKGKQLEEVELLRNLILMRYDIQQQSELFDKIWRPLSVSALQQRITEDELLQRVMLYKQLCTAAELKQRGILKSYSRIPSAAKQMFSDMILEYLMLLERVLGFSFSEDFKWAVQCMRWIPIGGTESLVMDLQCAVVAGAIPEEAALKILQIIDSFAVRSLILQVESDAIEDRISTAYSNHISKYLGAMRSNKASVTTGLTAVGELRDSAEFVSLEDKLDDFAYELFGNNAVLTGAFLIGIGAGKTISPALAEYILKCSEVKLCRKEITFEGAGVYQLIDGLNGNWKEWFTENGWQQDEYALKYGSTLANYVMIEHDLGFDNGTPESCFTRLHKSQYALTRGAKKHKELTPEIMAERIELLRKLATKLWEVPKYSMAAVIRTRGAGSWYQFDEIVGTTGLKFKELKVGKKMFSEAEVKLMVKNWKALSWLIIRTLLEDDTVDLPVGFQEKLIRDKALYVGDEPLFSLTNKTGYTQVSTNLFAKLETTPGKMVKQIAMLCRSLGCLSEVKIKFR